MWFKTLNKNIWKNFIFVNFSCNIISCSQISSIKYVDFNFYLSCLSFLQMIADLFINLFLDKNDDLEDISPSTILPEPDKWSPKKSNPAK